MVFHLVKTPQQFPNFSLVEPGPTRSRQTAHLNRNQKYIAVFTSSILMLEMCRDKVSQQSYAVDVQVRQSFRMRSIPSGRGLVWMQLSAAPVSGTSCRSSRNHGLHAVAPARSAYPISQMYGHHTWCSVTGLKTVLWLMVVNGHLRFGSGLLTRMSVAQRFDGLPVQSLSPLVCRITSSMRSANRCLISSVMPASSMLCSELPSEPVVGLPSRCRPSLKYTSTTKINSSV